MKIDRHGQAKVLTPQEIGLLFTQGARNQRDRALFAVMLYTACRVSEAVTLRTGDVYDRQGRVRVELIIRKGNTKGKLATRTIPVLEDLRRHLQQYKPSIPGDFLFPGKDHRRDYLHPDSAMWLLREACKRIGLEGASTHSFRRTALTQMSDAGIPLRVIQEISGHRNLEQLQKYLEVKPEQVRGAIAALSMLTPVEAEDLGKYNYDEAPWPDSTPQSQPRRDRT